MFRTRSVSLISLTLTASLMTLAIAACTASAPQPGAAPAPVITHVEKENDGSAKRVTITFDKKAILNQEFLYSLDLQYSSAKEQMSGSYAQSLSLPHQVARFRIFDGDLQLISDEAENFESKLNHPGTLITSYKILTETDSTLTVQGGDSTPYLDIMTQLLVRDGDAKAAPTKISRTWTRDFRFDPKDNILLQETSVMTEDGKTMEYMEAVFPRANLAPSKDFRILTDDADTELANRYRFLWTPKTIDGSRVWSRAHHFDLGDRDTIDWYVTRNLPSELLEPVKNGVEGWNRYFTQFENVKRPVMRFRGYLPEGISIGDPRYNVINWDETHNTSAAYASSGYDVTTGKVSHSLIYLPAGWISDGKSYFSGSTPALPESLTGDASAASPALKSLLLCSRDLKGAQTFLQANLATAPKGAPSSEMTLQLLQAVLFHEVGHTLGLAHNFKGSLAYDPENPATLGSTSVMDYYDYGLLARSFTDTKSPAGPIYEYDRQILDQIYDRGTGVKESDPVLPACEDAEADSLKGKVDPLCNRYDQGQDPSNVLEVSLSLIDKDSLPDLPGQVTLSQALRRLPELALPAEKLPSITDEASLEQVVTAYQSALGGTILNYLVYSTISPGNGIAPTSRMLLLTDDDALASQGYRPMLMRERAWGGLQKILGLQDLTANVQKALSDSEAAFVDRLLQTPAGSRLPKQIVLTNFEKFNGVLSNYAEKIFQSLKENALASFARKPSVPFYLGPGPIAAKDGHDILGTVDYESKIVALLLGMAVDPQAELDLRLRSAQSLMTYAGRPQGEKALQKLRQELLKERANAKDNTSREAVEAMLTAIDGAKMARLISAAQGS